MARDNLIIVSFFVVAIASLMQSFAMILWPLVFCSWNGNHFVVFIFFFWYWSCIVWDDNRCLLGALTKTTTACARAKVERCKNFCFITFRLHKNFIYYHYSLSVIIICSEGKKREKRKKNQTISFIYYFFIIINNNKKIKYEIKIKQWTVVVFIN